MQLTTGTHDVEIEYFEQSGEQVLQVEFEGPGVKRQALEYALVSATTESADSSRFVVDAALAERGQQLFGTLGCVACHQLRSEDRVIPAAPTFKPLAALDSSRGCLAVQTAAVSTDTAVQTNKVPNFHLSAGQRTALATALAALGQPATNAANAEVQIHHTLTAFNCYACHQRGEQGGIEEVRNAWFQSDQPEMGDEGRIPPHLTGVGAKLQPEWLKQLFDRGAKDRPYMFTRMPRFGSNNIGPLVTALAKADPPIADHVEVDQFDERHLKAAGRKLVGAEGFSCIKCHTWGDVKATGIQSINMVTMTRRLQANWFHQYMLDPQRYRPGTRMPAAWPQGQVLLPTLLDGQASTQIQSIWNYLSDGDKAAMPIGLGTDPIVLTATDEPIIYRNFIEGAGARAIGVGYPEKVNQAFDANNLRVALLWHGAFIDASKHWLGRGPGFQPPLGDNVLTLPDGVSFAILEDATAAWPTQTAKELGYAFRGYRLGEARRPTFHYTLGGVRVEDELVPISRDQFAPARRTLTLYATTPVTNLWYRAAVGKSVEAQADGSYLIDGSWKVRVPSDATRRESSGNVELLVPIDLSSGTTTLIQEYAW